MFRGSYTAKVDEKGRLKLPAAFKQLLDAQHETEFYITSTDGESAEIWPLSTWKQREAVMAQNIDDVAIAKYLTVTGIYGQQVEVDNQSRVLLPQDLRKSAQLEADVHVMGKTTYLVVNNLGKIEQQKLSLKITEQDFRDIAAKTSARNS
jgi:MraZ protein